MTAYVFNPNTGTDELVFAVNPDEISSPEEAQRIRESFVRIFSRDGLSLRWSEEAVSSPS